MEVVLNIGLNSNTLGVIPAQKALSEVRKVFGVHFNALLIPSDTEPTLVCEVIMTGHDSQENTRTLYKLAQTLGQDCIAVYARLPIQNFGALIGPRAADWGKFNPEFFIMPDGTRLASPAAKAA